MAVVIGRADRNNIEIKWQPSQYLDRQIEVTIQCPRTRQEMRPNRIKIQRVNILTDLN